MASLRGLTALITLCIALVFAAVPALAAPFAAYVMDARTGETLYSKNADTRLHPASLTKMMTLYITFEALERGEVTLDTKFTITQHAASQAPSRLGLKAGQKVALRYLIRAAAIKSANDAAVAIAEGIGGSETAFVKRMNRTAKALGMMNSTFKNANGLTAAGHLSTAHDMSILGRRLFYDFPQYYNIFSRRTADAGLAQVASTNRRFLDSYEGADGIKTGYTVAAGFNLTASAQRGNKRIIATIFGGTSTANRNERMTELLDMGFGKAPKNAPVDPPDAPVYADVEEPPPPPEDVPMASVDVETDNGAGKTIRLVTTMKVSPRPRARPSETELAAATAAASAAMATAATAALAPQVPDPAAGTEAAVVAMTDDIAGAVAQANAPLPFALADAAPAEAPPAPGTEDAVASSFVAAPALMRPQARPAEETAVAVAAAAPEPEAPSIDMAATDAAVAEALGLELAGAPAEEGTTAEVAAVAAETSPVALADAPPADAVPFEVIDAPQAGEAGALPFAVATAEDLPAEGEEAPLPQQAGMLAFLAPSPRPVAPAPAPEAQLAVLRPAPAPDAAPILAAEPEVVTRVSTSGGRHWGVSLGRYAAQAKAERVLMKTMLSENAALGDGLRKIVQRNGEFDATIMGLSEDQAALACRRLIARALECEPIGP